MNYKIMQYFFIVYVSCIMQVTILAMGRPNWIISFHNASDKKVEVKSHNAPVIVTDLAEPGVYKRTVNYEWQNNVGGQDRLSNFFTLLPSSYFNAFQFPLPWSQIPTSEGKEWIEKNGLPHLKINVYKNDSTSVINYTVYEYYNEANKIRYVIVKDGDAKIIQEGQIGQNWELRVFIDAFGVPRILDKSGKLILGLEGNWIYTRPINPY